MSDWPIFVDGQSWDTQGQEVGDTTGTSVIPSATVHVKSAWTTIFTAATDLSAIMLDFSFMSTSGTWLMDIGITYGGVQQVVIPDLLISVPGAQRHVHSYYLPIRAPAGLLVIARLQSSVANSGIDVIVHGLASGWGSQEGYSICRAYGVTTSVSGGTLISPGATANTKTAYVALGSPTTEPINALIVSIGTRGATAVSSAQAARVLFDIAYGASSVLVLDNVMTVSNTASDLYTPAVFGPVPVQIPAGEQMYARAQASVGSPTPLDFIVYGFS